MATRGMSRREVRAIERIFRDIEVLSKRNAIPLRRFSMKTEIDDELL